MKKILINCQTASLLLLVLGLSVSHCQAGGFLIQPGSVTFNGYTCSASFLPNQEIHMRYTATDYSFSGGVDQFEYFVFKLENKQDHSFQYILQLTSDYISTSLREDNFSFELFFFLPKVKGDYTISYYKAPMVSRVPLGNKQVNNMIWIDGEARGAIDRFVRSYGPSFQPLCILNVGGTNRQ